MPKCTKCNKKTFDGTKWKSTIVFKQFSGKYLCKSCYQETEAEKSRINAIEKGQLPDSAANLSQNPISFTSKYLGGHAGFANKSEGFLLLYQEQVIYTSSQVNIVIPFNKIKETKIITKKEFDAVKFLIVGWAALVWPNEDNFFSIAYQDELGETQTPVFFLSALEAFSKMLYQLRLLAK
jgi:hypothetical protein